MLARNAAYQGKMGGRSAYAGQGIDRPQAHPQLCCQTGRSPSARQACLTMTALSSPARSYMAALRIRQVRLHKKLSLRKLAELAEVSPGLISQVERGLTQPSLDTLRQIARALDTPLFSLLEDDVEQVAVVRKNERMSIQSASGVQYQRVSPGFGSIEMLAGFLPPGGSSVGQRWSHPAEECVLVTEGQLLVDVGDDQHCLQTGDS